MSLPIVYPQTRNDGLRNFIAMAFNTLDSGNVEEAKMQLVDLWNDVGLAYDCKEKIVEKLSPVPDYDAKTDGPYESWLVANNID